MRKIALTLGLLLAALCLNAQEVFLVKQGRGRAQQGMTMHGNWIFSCEDGGKVNLYDFRKKDGVPVASKRGLLPPAVHQRGKGGLPH